MTPFLLQTQGWKLTYLLPHTPHFPIPHHHIIFSIGHSVVHSQAEDTIARTLTGGLFEIRNNHLFFHTHTDTKTHTHTQHTCTVVAHPASSAERERGRSQTLNTHSRQSLTHNDCLSMYMYGASSAHFTGEMLVCAVDCYSKAHIEQL